MSGVPGMASGIRGQRHHEAKLTDQEVEWARELKEVHKVPIRQIAEKLEAPFETIRSIVFYRSRLYPSQASRVSKVPRGTYTPAL